MSHYDTATPVGEAVEVRLAATRGPAYVLTAWRTDHGTVAWMLTDGRGGTPHALSTLQPAKGVTMPGKAVAGWQAEVVAFCAAALYPIVEVR